VIIIEYPNLPKKHKVLCFIEMNVRLEIKKKYVLSPFYKLQTFTYISDGHNRIIRIFLIERCLEIIIRNVQLNYNIYKNKYNIILFINVLRNFYE
jgi:hypothetical protein